MIEPKRLPPRWQALIIGGCVLAFPLGALLLEQAKSFFSPQAASTELSSQSRHRSGVFQPTKAQWDALTTEAVKPHIFRQEFATEGKIGVNEDRSTPIFSPHAGRVTALYAKPGDAVKQGQSLFVVEATDTVQGLNDFIAALGATNTARSKLNLARIVEKRANDLYAGKAVPLKDWQQSQADLTTAENDMHSSETALEAVRNRLKILGRSDEEIAIFQEKRQIKADTPIVAPLAGTVVQRKIGPGQYLSNGATDPAYVIGDLSSVWLTAFVRETDAANVRLGQPLTFRVTAAPERTYQARIDYIASVFDPASRRLLVRATIENLDGVLKPEMFANVVLYADATPTGAESLAIPRAAIIYDGETARAWVAREDQSIELRHIKLGLANTDLVQVLNGLSAGERVVTRESLFIDRAAASDS